MLKKLLHNIAVNTKKVRTQRGMTQLELSHKTKLSLSTLADIEQGRRDNINLKTIVVLSTALKIPPLKLLK